MIRTNGQGKSVSFLVRVWSLGHAAGDAHGVTLSDTHADTHGDTHGDTHDNAHRDTHGDTHGDAHGDTLNDADADASTDRRGPTWVGEVRDVLTGQRVFCRGLVAMTKAIERMLEAHQATAEMPEDR